MGPSRGRILVAAAASSGRSSYRGFSPSSANNVPTLGGLRAIARRNGDAIDRLDRSPQSAAGGGNRPAAPEGGVQSFGKRPRVAIWEHAGGMFPQIVIDDQPAWRLATAGRVGCGFSDRPGHERRADRGPSARQIAQGAGRQAKWRRNVDRGAARLYRLGSAGVALCTFDSVFCHQEAFRRRKRHSRRQRTVSSTR